MNAAVWVVELQRLTCYLKKPHKCTTSSESFLTPDKLLRLDQHFFSFFFLFFFGWRAPNHFEWDNGQTMAERSNKLTDCSGSQACRLVFFLLFFFVYRFTFSILSFLWDKKFCRWGSTGRRAKPGGAPFSADVHQSFFSDRGSRKRVGVLEPRQPEPLWPLYIFFSLSSLHPAIHWLTVHSAIHSSRRPPHSDLRPSPPPSDPLHRPTSTHMRKRVKAGLEESCEGCLSGSTFN